MLEGLEIREIEFDSVINNKDFRVDSDFYTKEPKKNKSLKYIKIGDCLTSSQYGISISMNENKVGYPIYRMNEIHDMLCDLDVDKHAEISTTEFGKFELKNRDVLFNRTNSFEWVGRTGIYYQNDNAKRTFASYLVRFNPDENIVIAEYLATYLSSKYGIWDIKRRARQSINQTNVNPEEVKEIEIPIIDRQIQETIKFNFELANSKRIIANKLYSEAEDILLSELGLNGWKPQQEAVSVKSFADFATSGRLDAEYYQPKYDDLFAHLKKYETKPLSQIATISKSIEPGSDAYQGSGIPFVRVSNLSKYGLTEPDIHLDRVTYETAELKPKKDTILLSKDGSVGIAYKLEQDLDAITSGAILHLKITDKEFLPDYLTLVLNSIIVKMQAERDAGGSIIQHWKPSEIEQVIIPKLSGELQTQIAEKIQESFALKAESKRLLDLAKTAVETAIEHGEEKAIELLNN